MKSQLFLLHFAGGNRYSYNFLIKDLKEEFECIPLELPGRGNRWNEKLIKDKKEAVNDYVNQILTSRNNKPYMIYGHSMGAILGLLVAEKMEKNNDSPIRLLVSGSLGPKKKQKDDIKRHLLSEMEFKSFLMNLGGVSEEILDNQELFGLFNPVIRTDFELLENDDNPEEGLLVKTPITALIGDKEETVDGIENWRKFTLEGFSYNIFSGNHFFIHKHSIELVKIIRSNLSSSMSVLKKNSIRRS